MKTQYFIQIAKNLGLKSHSVENVVLKRCFLQGLGVHRMEGGWGAEWRATQLGDWASDAFGVNNSCPI